MVFPECPYRGVTVFLRILGGMDAMCIEKFAEPPRFDLFDWYRGYGRWENQRNADAVHPGTELVHSKRAAQSQKAKWEEETGLTMPLLICFIVKTRGDVKPRNIIIDEETNGSVLIDFGGGYTRKWVPQALANSVAGDLHGPKRLFELIDKLS